MSEFQGYFSVECVLIKPPNRNTFKHTKKLNYTEIPIIPMICHHCHMGNIYIYLHCWFIGVLSVFTKLELGTTSASACFSNFCADAVNHYKEGRRLMDKMILK